MPTSSTSSDRTPNPDADESPTVSAMTYAALLQHGRAYLQQQGMGEQQIRNNCSALRSWLHVHGFAAETRSQRFW